MNIEAIAQKFNLLSQESSFNPNIIYLTTLNKSLVAQVDLECLQVSVLFDHERAMLDDETVNKIQKELEKEADKSVEQFLSEVEKVKGHCGGADDYLEQWNQECGQNKGASQMSATTQMKTLSEFIAELNIQVKECKHINSNPNMPTWTDARHYQVTLINKEGKQFSIPFSMGSAHKLPPTAEDVLDCLASDSSFIENSENFHQWKNELGYESNKEAKNSYLTWKTNSVGLKVWLGVENYETLLYEVERL